MQEIASNNAIEIFQTLLYLALKCLSKMFVWKIQMVLNVCDLAMGEVCKKLFTYTIILACLPAVFS